MRVILVGPAASRERTRLAIPNVAIHIVGEAPTLEAARELQLDADAYVVAADPPSHATQRAIHVVEHSKPHTMGPAETRSFRLSRAPEPSEPLTPREREVLGLVAEGLPNKTIAIRLGISDQTVKFHVAAIAGKLGAVNRTDAVRRAIRRGIVSV